MELSIPASPSRLATLRRAARAYLRGVSAEAADEVVLALHEVATNAVLHGSRAGQPIQVHVHPNHGWVQASVLDHGPQPPAGLPAAASPGELRAFGQGLWLLHPLVDEIRLEPACCTKAVCAGRHEAFPASDPAVAAVLVSDGRRNDSAVSGLQLRRSSAWPLAV